MDSAFILGAIRRKYPTAAIVPEVVMDDPSYAAGDRGDEETVKPQRRIDALMFQTLERTAIEIKTTRADFHRDTWAKRRPWFTVCHRFVYVVPHDLDVIAPHNCGLWRVQEDGTVTVATKAKVSTTPEPLPQQVVQSLAYRAARVR